MLPRGGPSRCTTSTPVPGSGVPTGRTRRYKPASALQATTGLGGSLAHGPNRRLGSCPTRRSCQVHLEGRWLKSLERLDLFMLALVERRELLQCVLRELEVVLLGVFLEVLG